MFRFFYNLIVIPVVLLAAAVAAVFSKKISKSLKSRKDLFKKLKEKSVRLNPYKKTILFHCSSLGEYKQALPIINEFRKEHDKYNIILSLFSPSAYENMKTVPLLEVITYAPFDLYGHMNKFLNICKPDLVIISKHDVWPNFIFELKKRGIPTYLVNALFATDSKMGHWYAKPFFKALYGQLTGIITIDKENRDRFNTIFSNSDKLFISGDSRYDTVLYDVQQSVSSDIIARLKISDRIFVAGSSWPAGEKYIIKGWEKVKEKYDDAFLIIVPHEIEVEHIYKIETLCQESSLNYVVYSELGEDEDLKNYDILIMDVIGLLAAVYGVGSLAYVGGGFGKAGLHSVLEPAVYGLPVFFGPNLAKSPEAKLMEIEKCGIKFNDEHEFYDNLDRLWSDEMKYRKVSEASKAFIVHRVGATKKIVDIVSKDIKADLSMADSFTEEELERLLEDHENK